MPSTSSKNNHAALLKIQNQKHCVVIFPKSTKKLLKLMSQLKELSCFKKSSFFIHESQKSKSLSQNQINCREYYNQDHHTQDFEIFTTTICDLKRLVEPKITPFDLIKILGDDKVVLGEGSCGKKSFQNQNLDNFRTAKLSNNNLANIQKGANDCLGQKEDYFNSDNFELKLVKN